MKNNAVVKVPYSVGFCTNEIYLHWAELLLQSMTYACHPGITSRRLQNPPLSMKNAFRFWDGLLFTGDTYTL